MNYQQAVDFIQTFPDSERGTPGNKPARSLKMPLSTMKALLQKMGNPQNNAFTIHITGSKGKGSTATFIESILREAGLNTALFTSPHIHSYTERIMFDGKPIAEEAFAQGISELKPLIEEFDRQGETVSTFGILTALFFQLAASRTLAQQTSPLRNGEHPAIVGARIHTRPLGTNVAFWQIVEVGLGGKDDLTNVFEQKAVVVITPISLEHTAILGDTRVAIAENKAGIITPGCLVVLAPQPDEEVSKTIRRIRKEKGAQLIEHRLYNPLPYPIRMIGEHQKQNALTALAVIDALMQRKKISITPEAIEKGLANVFLPGRFEIIEHGLASFAPTGSMANTASSGRIPSAPTTRAADMTYHVVGVDAIDPRADASPFEAKSYDIVGARVNAPVGASCTIVLDGAHNGDSAKALAKTLHQSFPNRDIILIIGVNQDKDLEGMWQELKQAVSIAVATRSDNHRSLSPEEISKRIIDCDPEATIKCTRDIKEALEKAKELAKDFPAPIICICGSLYLVAEARELLLQ